MKQKSVFNAPNDYLEIKSKSIILYLLAQLQKDLKDGTPTYLRCFVPCQTYKDCVNLVIKSKLIKSDKKGRKNNE